MVLDSEFTKWSFREGFFEVVAADGDDAFWDGATEAFDPEAIIWGFWEGFFEVVAADGDDAFSENFLTTAENFLTLIFPFRITVVVDFKQ